jgi:peptide/nickel transport system permease protein
MEQEQDSREQGSARRRSIRYALYLLRRNPAALVGLVISAVSIALALLAGVLVDPSSYTTQNLNLRLCWNNPAFNWGIANVFTCSGQVYPLGTDAYGRSVLNMILLAIPIDLQIAFEVVASAVALGLLLGGVAAYVGGLADEVILRVTDIFLSIPSILLAIFLIVVLHRSLTILTIAVVITWWPYYVRLARSQVLAEKQKPYVERLRSMGASPFRILFRHIIPNSVYPVIVQATLDIGSVILIVSALTFIGLTPNPLLPELGNLANQGISYFFTAPWLILFPGLTILLISLGFNLLGDGIRDIFDPRLRR